MSPARWYRATVRAIDDDPAVRPYLLILSLCLSLEGISWVTYKNVTAIAWGGDAVCWPTIPQCERLRSFLTEADVALALKAYVALGLVGAILVWRRRVGAALAVFLGTAVLGAALYGLDYRLRANETYMLSFCVLTLVLAPRKGVALQAMLGSFYFWAGTLKLNADWITGAALYDNPYLVPTRLIPASCVYVVVLELVLVWGLFSANARVRWAVYAQFVLFHAVSWRVVGYHYPLLMFGLTAIFPLVWRLSPEQTLTFGLLRTDTLARRTAATAAVVFAALQIAPRLHAGDAALTGEGRLFSLHMFDARVICDGGATIRGASGNQTFFSLVDAQMTERMRCDPVYILAAAHRVCKRAEAAPEPVTSVDVLMHVRHATDPDMKPFIDITDFCHKSIEYSPWHHNDWIGQKR